MTILVDAEKFVLGDLHPVDVGLGGWGPDLVAISDDWSYAEQI